LKQITRTGARWSTPDDRAERSNNDIRACLAGASTNR
jgi:hypothetical protein